jgi:hypothetical protein
MLGHAAHVGPWAHTGPCRAMLAHVAHPDPCWPILTHVGPCSPMLPHVGPCWPMLPHVGPCWPMLAQQPDGQLPANATAVAAPQACQTRVKMHAPSTQPSKTQCVCMDLHLNSHSVAEWWQTFTKRLETSMFLQWYVILWSPQRQNTQFLQWLLHVKYNQFYRVFFCVLKPS